MAIGREETGLTRRHRIEIVRYRRRVTVTREPPAANESEVDLLTGGQILDVSALIPPPEPEGGGGAVPDETRENRPRRRGLLFWLGGRRRPRQRGER